MSFLARIKKRGAFTVPKTERDFHALKGGELVELRIVHVHRA